MTSPRLSLIASVDRRGGIGRAGELLVRIGDDLRRLKALTMGAPIVMGRKTWDSIGKPLPGRRNLVVTRQPEWRAEGAERAASLTDALALAAPALRVWILGGAELFAQALPLADVLELTEIDAEFTADTFFPAWDRAEFRQTARDERQAESGLRYAFATYQRIASPPR